MEKNDVFLKTSNLDNESIKNLKRWISIFSLDSNYTIKLIIPKQYNNDLIHRLFNNIKIYNDIDINDTTNINYKIFYNSLTVGKKPGIGNLTCYEYAETSFFWNIDGDDTYFTLDSLDDKELLFKLKEIEIITKKNKYYAASLDFYRIFNYHNNMKWSDHWSFGLCFMKNNLKIITDILSTTEVLDRGFGINSDHIFDTIRKNNNIKIGSFVIKNSKLIHPTISRHGCPLVVHKYNSNNKETYNNNFKNVNNYTEIDNNYIII